ncbi:hypothetical protein [uncultured Clostridium sp.]|uniref:hypothetical protein n=1 Tax=uncultured Clostridium sp. TaxID=59620 RepID=UPI00262C8EE8|nr:hypothetical protein [uncultured Clostridium sp.]
MPIPVITSIISAISIICGSLLGGFLSWIINNKLYDIRRREDDAKLQENREYEERFKIKEVCANANVIRLDVCTAIYTSIRGILNFDSIEYIYILPINKGYSCAVASLSDKYNLKELSYIYQLYGIIEKVNRDIIDCKEKEEILKGFYSIIKKIYGNNYKEILEIDINNVTYKQLCRNEYIKKGYADVLKKLDYLCAEENILKEKLQIKNKSIEEEAIKRSEK